MNTLLCQWGFVTAMVLVAVASGNEVVVSHPEAISAAVAAADAGDVVVVQDGSYRDWRVQVRGKGAPQRPIVLRAATPGGVTLSGQVRLEISGEHVIVEGFQFQKAHSAKHSSIVEFRRAAHCRLTACAFTDCGDPASTFTRTINLAYGSHHCRVDHCLMVGTLSMGMGMVVRATESGQGNTDNRFDHNYFRDIRRLSSNGQEPIQLGQDQTAFGDVSVRAIVEYNLFEKTSGDGEIISNKSADNVIRYNTMRNSKAGICLRGGRNVRVEGNFCYRTYGIRVFGSDHTIVNNYLEETEDGLRLDAGQYRKGEFIDRDRSGSYEAASGILFAHNTIVNSKGIGIGLGTRRGTTHGGVVRSELPREIRFVNNLISGGSQVLVAEPGCTNVRWQTNIVWPQVAGTFGEQQGLAHLDPCLSAGENGRFVPGNQSPTKNAGIALSNVTLDISGQVRDARPDIGCDEIGSDGQRRQPLGPADVGPAWATP